MVSKGREKNAKTDGERELGRVISWGALIASYRSPGRNGREREEERREKLR